MGHLEAVMARFSAALDRFERTLEDGTNGSRDGRLRERLDALDTSVARTIALIEPLVDRENSEDR
jgi:hypothetical protein